MVRYLEGDLMLSRAQVLAHGVNCRGSMGAGIAVAFKRRFPAMFQEYRRHCQKGILTPGGLFLWKEESPWVLNLATQAHKGRAELPYVREAFAVGAALIDGEGVRTVAMPRIAAGLGGLAWEEVRPILEEAFHPLPARVFVYDRFFKGKKGDET